MRLLRLAFRHGRGLSWAFLLLALVGVFVLGTIGVRKHLAATDPEHTYSLTTLVFLVLQMLGLDWGGVPEPVSWELEIARVLAVLVFLGAVAKAVLAFLRRPLEGFWLKYFARNHSIVCGLGDKGARIAQQLLDRGDFVAIVERHEELSAVAELRSRGAIVVTGDAAHADVLRSLSVHRSRRVVVTCGDDGTNLGVGSVAARSSKSKPGKTAPLVHIHCTDPAAFELFKAAQETPSVNHTAADVKRFSIPENAARLLLAAYPLDRLQVRSDSQDFVQLLILGRSPEADSMLLHAAGLAHCANLAAPAITVIAPDADLWEHSLRFRFPRIDNACRLSFVRRELCHPETYAELDRLLSDPKAISTVAIAPDDGRDTLPLAARLPAVAAARGVRVFLRTNLEDTLTCPRNQAGVGIEFVTFDTLDNACDLESVLQEGLDRQAKVMHGAYEKKALADGRSPATTPAIRPWAALAETYRQSNRRNADHIPVKLRAIGRVAEAAPGTGVPAADFTPDEIEIMARMEHTRWNADRWLDGWQFGPTRDNALKIHPNLVSWEELDEKTKDYDREAVRQIPAMLSAISNVITKTG